MSRTHIQSNSQSHSHSQEGKTLPPPPPTNHISVAQGEYSCHHRQRGRQGCREGGGDSETDRQRAGKEAKQNMLVTLHFDALNACCASKLIAAACCSAPKFNAKFNKYNNGAPISDCPQQQPPSTLFPNSPRRSLRQKTIFNLQFRL